LDYVLWEINWVNLQMMINSIPKSEYQKKKDKEAKSNKGKTAEGDTYQNIQDFSEIEGVFK